MQGKIIAFSAPSGAGKTTIVHRLMERIPELSFSISACTRDRRGRTEQNGKDYYFITVQEFQEKIRHDEFVEWEEVYEGSYYGTLKSEIERIWGGGKHAILDIDVKGGLSVKEFYKDRALCIFVKPPSLEVLEQRLKARATDSASSISARLYKANFELTFEDRFDAVIVNDDLDQATAQAEKLVRDFITAELAIV
ncbi:guanylate kinase [Hymenobacter oligotrophus]|uniref:Guanylate kinase n=1 Tax=Hymenobacter oligotrophus TaxID=2319843 RepID=A0A3B7R511_9BACT|nr:MULTISPECIES: guanylate kinase [Hymenobacter]AYA38420.1 guanylate kinase [Hymenobacter oligotrophus]UYZ58875.1 guanylate kinase [Hymenobacter sp. YIM 151858-1]